MLAVFEKTERVRHIGHLDLMRSMGRALRRSGLPVSYSKGFSPHVLLTFASALSVGAVGLREIMDVTLDREVTPEEFISRMNAALPPELFLKEARPLDDRHPAPMAMVEAASWELRILDGDAAARIADALPGFLAQESVMAERKTKSGVKECDIRPLIHSLTMEENALRAVLALTERESCKPDMLLKALFAFADLPQARTLTVRLALLGRNAEGTLVPLETL